MSTVMIAGVAAIAGEAIRWDQLGVGPIALDLGFFQLRWYSLGYLAGIILGWWYLLKLLAKPGAPMARRHADDLVFYATLGILLGGRLGYVFFYRPEFYLANPLEIPQLWDGGMSLHGGVIGTLLGIFYLCRRNQLSFLRVCDYVACAAPFGLFLVRLANFTNGELWGRPTNVPWAVVFPEGGETPRHPSQLYEAGLEGIGLFVLLWFLFWKTDARYQPGRLWGAGLLWYGLSRFLVELVRQPDRGLENLPWGLTMGQTLTVPMLLGGAYLVATSSRRRQRVEPIAGAESVA